MTNKLKFDFNAICALEEETGQSLESFFNNSFGENSTGMPKFAPLRLLYFFGLKHEKTDLTLLEAGDILNAKMAEKDGFMKITEELSEAINKALPQLDETGEAAEDKKKRQTDSR